MGLFIALPYAAAFLIQYILGYISPLFSGNEPLFWHITIAAVFLFNTAETFNAALGSVCFFCSFMTMYSLVVFIRVADSTSLPAFWAAAGRGLKYLAGGIFALAGSHMFFCIF